VSLRADRKIMEKERPFRFVNMSADKHLTFSQEDAEKMWSEYVEKKERARKRVQDQMKSVTKDLKQVCHSPTSLQIRTHC
jgi:hypothetical protein